MRTLLTGIVPVIQIRIIIAVIIVSEGRPNALTKPRPNYQHKRPVRGEDERNSGLTSSAAEYPLLPGALRAFLSTSGDRAEHLRGPHSPTKVQPRSWRSLFSSLRLSATTQLGMTRSSQTANR